MPGACGNGPGSGDGVVRVRPQTPDDMLIALAHMLGFWPDDSVVVALIDAGGVAGVVRCDIEGLAPLALVDMLVPARQRIACTGVLLAGYGERERVDEALRAVEFAFADQEVIDVLGTDWRTWWWRDAEALPMPDHLPDIGRVGRRVGGAMMASRELIAARVRRPDQLRQGELAHLVQAEEHVLDLDARDALDATRILVRRGLADPRGITDAERVRLALLLMLPDCRDTAWISITDASAEAALELWLTVCGVCIDMIAPGPLCMAATAAWLRAEWVLMGECLTQALEINPAYSLAALLQTVQCTGADPTLWLDMVANLPAGH